MIYYHVVGLIFLSPWLSLAWLPQQTLPCYFNPLRQHEHSSSYHNNNNNFVTRSRLCRDFTYRNDDGVFSFHAIPQKKQEEAKHIGKYRHRVFSKKKKFSTYPYPSTTQRNASLSSDQTTTQENKNNNNNLSTLDIVLDRITSAFPLFVLVAAILAVIQPQTLLWINRGSLIPIAVASVMGSMGLTLEPQDFIQVFSSNWKAVPLGVLCQFIIMPCTAWIVGRSLLLTGFDSSIGPSLFLGLCLVGCSPGGTASNLVALIADADVALSVILTACSTLMAVFMTPLLVKLLAGSKVTVSAWTLCLSTARVVLGPVLIGMILNQQVPKVSRKLSKWAPPASVILVALICGGVVAQNAPLLLLKNIYCCNYNSN